MKTKQYKELVALKIEEYKNSIEQLEIEIKRARINIKIEEENYEDQSTN